MSERLGQFQDVCVGEFTGGDLTDVDDLTGAALENQHREESSNCSSHQTNVNLYTTDPGVFCLQSTGLLSLHIQNEQLHIVKTEVLPVELRNTIHLNGRVARGVTDPHRPAAHRRRDVTAVKLGHGSSFFFGLKLKVGLMRRHKHVHSVNR